MRPPVLIAIVGLELAFPGLLCLLKENPGDSLELQFLLATYLYLVAPHVLVLLLALWLPSVRKVVVVMLTALNVVVALFLTKGSGPFLLFYYPACGLLLLFIGLVIPLLASAIPRRNRTRKN